MWTATWITSTTYFSKPLAANPYIIVLPLGRVFVEESQVFSLKSCLPMRSSLRSGCPKNFILSCQIFGELNLANLLMTVRFLSFIVTVKQGSLNRPYFCETSIMQIAGNCEGFAVSSAVFGLENFSAACGVQQCSPSPFAMVGCRV